MFRLRRNIRIIGTREDGSAFDPIAESHALDEEERMVRRYLRPRPSDLEHDSGPYARSIPGAFREPHLYGATANAAAPQRLGAVLEPNADAALRRCWAPDLLTQGLALAGWALAPLAVLAMMACAKVKASVARR